MGQIVAAAVVAHQPIVMAPEDFRRMGGGGEDTSLVSGFARIREAMDAAGVDTWIIFDTHWYSTVEHVVAGAEHFKGVYTSDELPTLIHDLPYDYPGAPALAHAVTEAARERGVRALNATSPYLAQHYPTLNLVHHMHRGEKVLTVGVCQTAQPHNFLDFGATIAEAANRTDGRVALLASGGMTHRFWPMDEILDHTGYAPEHCISPAAVDVDQRILEHWRNGEHAAVIDAYPDIKPFHPEGDLGHYLMMVGALGGRDCTATGRQLSAYENAVGTGQVHMWFDTASVAAATL